MFTIWSGNSYHFFCLQNALWNPKRSLFIKQECPLSILKTVYSLQEQMIKLLIHSSLLSFLGFHQDLASSYISYSGASKNNFLIFFKLNILKIRDQQYFTSERSKLLLQLLPSLNTKDMTNPIPQTFCSLSYHLFIHLSSKHALCSTSSLFFFILKANKFQRNCLLCSYVVPEALALEPLSCKSALHIHLCLNWYIY